MAAVKLWRVADVSQGIVPELGTVQPGHGLLSLLREHHRRNTLRVA